jgi:hypothetical protein
MRNKKFHERHIFEQAHSHLLLVESPPNSPFCFSFDSSPHHYFVSPFSSNLISYFHSSYDVKYHIFILQLFRNGPINYWTLFIF